MVNLTYTGAGKWLDQSYAEILVWKIDFAKGVQSWDKKLIVLKQITNITRMISPIKALQRFLMDHSRRPIEHNAILGCFRPLNEIYDR
jgi:hypothetical protein